MDFRYKDKGQEGRPERKMFCIQSEFFILPLSFSHPLCEVEPLEHQGNGKSDLGKMTMVIFRGSHEPDILFGW